MCAPDGNRHRFRTETEHHGIRTKTRPHRVCDLLRRGIGGETFNSVADILQSLIRLKEEISSHLHIA
uniref:hypothetical protein n=1 Tax=Brucella pseudintermedia TaxID=370111 RepID=UPI001F391724|nr:hypothetical protein [Brucella pseudintermedia]